MKRIIRWLLEPSGQCALQRRDYELINLEVLLSDTVVWATVGTAAGVILRCLRIIS